MVTDIFMVFFNLLIDKFRWPFRKLYFLKSKKIVLYLGSDFIPPRADIVIIPHNNSRQSFLRCKDTNRIYLYCNCNKKIPLTNKSVDFLVLSSALEYCHFPDDLLLEISRIGKEGYLESASALLDRFYPHPYRKIEILENKKKLILNRKYQGVQDHYLAESRLFQTNKNWNFLFKFFPNIFFITYKWKEKIEFSYIENKSIKSKSLTQMWVDHFVETCNTISKKNTLKSRLINLINVFHIRSRKKRLLNFEKSIMLD